MEYVLLAIGVIVLALVLASLAVLWDLRRILRGKK